MCVCVQMKRNFWKFSVAETLRQAALQFSGHIQTWQLTFHRQVVDKKIKKRERNNGEKSIQESEEKKTQILKYKQQICSVTFLLKFGYIARVCVRACYNRLSRLMIHFCIVSYITKKSVRVIKHRTIKACGEMEVYLHVFLTSALNGGVVSFTPRPLHPRGKSPWHSLVRRIGGPPSRCGSFGEKTDSLPFRESNFDSSATKPVA
jgi:hypothetical protein